MCVSMNIHVFILATIPQGFSCVDVCVYEYTCVYISHYTTRISPVCMYLSMNMHMFILATISWGFSLCGCVCLWMYKCLYLPLYHKDLPCVYISIYEHTCVYISHYTTRISPMWMYLSINMHVFICSKHIQKMKTDI